MRKAKRGCLGGCLTFVVLPLLLFLTRGYWLPPIGHALVRADSPAPADAVVVLAGDTTLERLYKGEQMVRDGFAPVALVSGVDNMFGRAECDFAIDAAKRNQHDTSKMVCVGNAGRNTVDECKALLPELARRQVKRVLVVTSNYHTRRAGNVWRRFAPQLEIRMVAARDRDFSPDTWWQNREAQKIVILEWTKTVAYLFGV